MKSIRIGSRSRGAEEELARSVPTIDLPSVFFFFFGFGFGVVVETGACQVKLAVHSAHNRSSHNFVLAIPFSARMM